ncbi:MAG: LamG-like jellyroll fold domain-containing protein [Akkermansia sp.]
MTYGKNVTTTTDNEDGTTSSSTAWQDGSVTYADSGMTTGTAVGNRQLTQDLGRAVTLSDKNWIKVGDAYWSNGLGALHNSSYTLMAWIKLDNTNGTKSIFGTGDGSDKGIKFDIKGNKISLTYKNVAEYTDSGSITLSAGTWYNVAVAVDAELQD